MTPVLTCSNPSSTHTHTCNTPNTLSPADSSPVSCNLKHCLHAVLGAKPHQSQCNAVIAALPRATSACCSGSEYAAWEEAAMLTYLGGLQREGIKLEAWAGPVWRRGEVPYCGTLWSMTHTVLPMLSMAWGRLGLTLKDITEVIGFTAGLTIWMEGVK